MARLLLAALALGCCLGLSAGAGRSLLITDQELQSQIQGLDQAAGQVFSQVSDAVASSGVVTPTKNDYSSDLHDKTIDAINKHAPLWKSDMGYFIRPQLSSALYNAVNHLGPAEPPAFAPALGPAAAQAAQSAPTSAGGRRLLQGDYGYSLSYALSPAPSPQISYEAGAAYAPLSADALYEAAASPDADLYSSYKKKNKKKNAGVATPVDAAAGSGAASGAVTSVSGAATASKQVVGMSKQLQAASPSQVAAQRSTATADRAATTSLAQDLQPKSTSSDNGVSLDPNLPNALPGPLRLATQQQAKSSGYQAQPTSTYTATDGTAFAGTPVDKLPGPLRIDATTPFDGPSVSGSEISLILGTRIATPFFGTGFNFCVDRYFGSFPKVGIVIPNPAQWLLPELQDIGRTLQTTLQLPPDATIGHGFTLQPTSDGLLINLPDGVQPNNIPDGGVRYGIQIGQAFGYDFGIGIIRDICFITFTTV